MHNLEHTLMMLAARIKTETGSTELANDAMSLAITSHDYSPENGEERLAKLNEQWRKKYGTLLHGFLNARYSVGELQSASESTTIGPAPSP
jgi:hypothetical protein